MRAGDSVSGRLERAGVNEPALGGMRHAMGEDNADVDYLSTCRIRPLPLRGADVRVPSLQLTLGGR